MKLNVYSFSFAVGIVTAAAFTVCAFLFAVAPEATSAFIGYLLHLNLTGVTRPVTWGGYFAGALGTGIWTGLWAAVVAKLYNRSQT